MTIAFNGKSPIVSEMAFVAPTATLIGDVGIGKDSSVWFGAVLRGDSATIHIGEGTSVQDNSVLHCEKNHEMTIGNNVTIGHGAIVHCTSIGDNTMVGMGAILLDGAVIGKNCIIGAGAVVKENALVPDGTMMVGVPAKPVRELGPEQLAFVAQTSPYVALSKEYLK